MGYVKVHGTVANPMKQERKAELEFIADTGAIYTVIPRSVAKRLGLKVGGKRKFKIASGDVVEYPISEAYVKIGDNGITSPVALAPERTPILLGVVTLESLGLQVDPITGKLTPLELMILWTFPTPDGLFWIKGVVPSAVLIAFIHNMRLKVAGRVFETKVGIADSNDIPPILGRFKSLDLFGVEFRKGREMTFKG